MELILLISMCFEEIYFQRASVAQSVEQLIRNQQVEGSTPSAGSLFYGESQQIGLVTLSRNWAFLVKICCIFVTRG